jgi:hypothetical protein
MTAHLSYLENHRAERLLYIPTTQLVTPVIDPTQHTPSSFPASSESKPPSGTLSRTPLIATKLSEPVATCRVYSYPSSQPPERRTITYMEHVPCPKTQALSPCASMLDGGSRWPPTPPRGSKAQGHSSRCERPSREGKITLRSRL